jgi:hypothetical protein
MPAEPTRASNARIISPGSRSVHHRVPGLRSPVESDSVKLVERYGADTPVPDCAARLRCSKCLTNQEHCCPICYRTRWHWAALEQTRGDAGRLKLQ